MEEKVISLVCPMCGAAISVTQKVCEYCHSPITICNLKSLNNLNLQSYIKNFSEALNKNKTNTDISTSLAMCFLKLKQYQNAIKNFEAISNENITNPNYYYYYALALLEGKKPFLVSMSSIKKAISLLDTAVLLQDEPIYHYFLAYIKYDFYKRKFLNIEPSYKDELALTINKLSDLDITSFYNEINQSEPTELENERKFIWQK